MSEFWKFLTEHPEVAGIGSSLIWFMAGRQSISNGKPENAIFWESGGFLIALATCIYTLKTQEWVGLTFGVTLIVAEILWVIRERRSRGQQKRRTD